MIRAHHIGTTTVQGPAHDMPVPFDPQAHIPPQERGAEAASLGNPWQGSGAQTSPSKGGCSKAEGVVGKPHKGDLISREAAIEAVKAQGEFASAGKADDWLEGFKEGVRAVTVDTLMLLRKAPALPAADPTPATSRSPLEHERDAGLVLDPASEVAWLRKIGINSAADLIEALVAECSREFARGYEVGAVEGPRRMTEAEVDELLGVKREGKA